MKENTEDFLTIFRRAKARKIEWQKEMEGKLNEMSKQIEKARHSQELEWK